MSCKDDFNKYIESECKWIGSNYDGRVRKNDLIKICDELGLEHKGSDGKTRLYKKITNEISNYKIYLKLRDKALGIPSHTYENKFGITRNQRKKMLETGFIKVRYYVVIKIVSRTYANVPYADAHQFYFMTQEKIDSWREKNIRGFKKITNKKECI